MVSRNRKPAWSELPQELLSAIANFLTSNLFDILVFRSVCISWRSSFPRLPHSSLLSPPLPLSVPSPLEPRSPRMAQTRPFLTVTVIYSLRCPLQLPHPEFSPLRPASWISFITEYTPGNVGLSKPFDELFYALPINFPKTINLIDLNARELGRFYSLNYSNKNNIYRGDLIYRPPYFSEYVDKLVLLPSALAAVTLFSKGKLGIIRFNDMSQSVTDKWEIIHDGKGFRFDDIVVFKGRVLGIDRSCSIYEIGYHSSEIIPFVPSIAVEGEWRKRFVESLGLLYLVVRCNVDPCESFTRTKIDVGLNGQPGYIKFKVYELDEGKKKWVEIRSLGNRSFFFGLGFSFSASAKELGTCGKNCILFQRQSFESYNTVDIDNETYLMFRHCGSSCPCVGVYHMNDIFQSRTIETYPGYSDVLWPPPPWILSVDRWKRLEIVQTVHNEMINMLPEKFKTMVKVKSVEGVEVPFYDCHQRDMLLIVKEVLKLMEMATTFQEGYKKSRVLEKKLQDALSFQEFKDMLNQVNSSQAQARESCPGTKKRRGWLNELQSALEQFQNGIVPPPYAIRGVLRERDVLLFKLEESTSNVERSYKPTLVLSNGLTLTEDTSSRVRVMNVLKRAFNHV